jgi:hypothetical protein
MRTGIYTAPGAAIRHGSFETRFLANVDILLTVFEILTDKCHHAIYASSSPIKPLSHNSRT